MFRQSLEYNYREFHRYYTLGMPPNKIVGSTKRGDFMNIVVSTATDNTMIVIPINFVLWGFVIAYVIHILEESLFPEVFVDKVKRLYWPQYNWTKFFGFNTLLLSVNIAAVIIYESVGGAWIIFPLSLACERILNGLYHLGETIRTKTFSSGLLSSVITWILAYITIRYSFMRGEITLQQAGISISIGVVMFLFMIVPLITGKLRGIK